MADPRSAGRRSFVADLKVVTLEPTGGLYGEATGTNNEAPTTSTKEPFVTNEDGTLTCNSCGKRYKQMGYMRKHLLTHGVSETLLECKKCQKTFDAQKKLTRHVGMKSDCRKLL